MRKSLISICIAVVLVMSGCGKEAESKNKVVGVFTDKHTESVQVQTTEPIVIEPETTTKHEMTEAEREQFIYDSADTVIRYVGEMLSNNLTYAVSSLRTYNGNYVELGFYAEAKYENGNIIEEIGTVNHLVAYVWVSDELEITECYFTYKNSSVDENTMEIYEYEKYNDPEGIDEKLQSILSKLNEVYSYSGLKVLDNKEIFKIYDNYMTTYLVSLETVKKEDIIRTEKKETIEQSSTLTYNSEGILVEKVIVKDGRTETYKYNDNGYLINNNNSKYPYNEVKEYDEKGNLIKITGGYDNYIAWICEYDNRGNLIREKLYYDERQNITYEYDENGFLIKKVTYDGDEVYSYIKYENDEDGRMIRWTKCTENGKELLSKYYTYDKAGNTIKIEWREDVDSTKYNQIVFYRYDSEGRLLREYLYNKEYGVSDIVEYDTVGNQWKSTSSKLEYTYYDDGRVKTITAYSGSNNKKIGYKEYDEKGREILYINYKTDMYGMGWTETTTYEYYD